MTTPEIRFQEFESEWRSTSFDKLVSREGLLLSACGDLPTVEFEDIISGEGRLNKDISKKQSRKTGIAFESGDILYGKLRPYLKNWLHASFSGIAVGDFWVLRPKASDSSFIYNLIQSEEFQKVTRVTSGSKMPRADWAVVANAHHAVPSFTEQKSIGHLFNDLDKLVEAAQSKLDTLRNLKQTMLVKMFPQPGNDHTNVPEIRFKGFEGEWKREKVGKFYEFKNGLNKGKEYFGYGVPIVNFTDVFHKRGLTTRDISGRVDASPEEIRNLQVKKGDIFFTRTSETIEEVGMPSVFLDQPEHTVFSGFVLRGRAITRDPLDDLFKTYAFFTKSFRSEMTQKSSMTTRALTSSKALKNMYFNFPSDLNEQRVIGNYFRNLDELITTEDAKLTKLTQLKSALLDGMFV